MFFLRRLRAPHARPLRDGALPMSGPSRTAGVSHGLSWRRYGPWRSQVTPLAETSSTSVRETSFQEVSNWSISMTTYCRPQVRQAVQGAWLGSWSQGIEARRLSSESASSNVANSPCCCSACSSSSIMNMQTPYPPRNDPSTSQLASNLAPVSVCGRWPTSSRFIPDKPYGARSDHQLPRSGPSGQPIERSHLAPICRDIRKVHWFSAGTPWTKVAAEGFGAMNRRHLLALAGASG